MITESQISSLLALHIISIESDKETRKIDRIRARSVCRLVDDFFGRTVSRVERRQWSL
jgi:hypothetical protein